MDFLEVYLTALAFVLFLGLVVLGAFAILWVGNLFTDGHYILGALGVAGLLIFLPAVLAAGVVVGDGC